MVELTFVNVNHPVQLRNPKYRRQIRSHISKVQHEQKRSAIDRAVGKLRLDAQYLTGDDSDISPLEEEEDVPTACHSSGAPVRSSRATTPFDKGQGLRVSHTTTITAREPLHCRHRAPIPSSSDFHVLQDETQHVRDAPIHAPPPTPHIRHSLTDTTDELQIFARHAEMSVPAMLVLLRHSPSANSFQEMC